MHVHSNRNYFEVLHLYKLPASAYFIRYKVHGGTFDLAIEVTQDIICHTCTLLELERFK